VCRGWSPRASCGTDLAHRPCHRTGVPRIDEECALCSIPEPPCPGFRGMGRRGNPRKRGGHLESWTQFGQLESSASGTTAQMGPSGGELQCWKSAWPTSLGTLRAFRSWYHDLERSLWLERSGSDICCCVVAVFDIVESRCQVSGCCLHVSLMVGAQGRNTAKAGCRHCRDSHRTPSAGTSSGMSRIGVRVRRHLRPLIRTQDSSRERRIYLHQVYTS
jgi:hypothetical protein